MGKFIFCIAILLASTLIGKTFTDKHAKKYSFYDSLKRFNLSLKQNIKFKRKNIIELLDFKTSDEDFNCFLSSYKLKVTAINDEKIYTPTWASEEDVEFLTSYLNGIGKNGSISELDFLNSYEDGINDKLIKIKENDAKYSKLGQKLGFAVGMGLVVIIL
ncbi:MAG: hypothetical protein IJW26_03755 [Clostridia bacterium]|nr:hypothetical protein [Clostridia bacterium]